MSGPSLACQDERRRRSARESGRSGIDYVEVHDVAQLTLCVHLFGPIPERIDAASVRIEGGRRIRDVRVIDVELDHPPDTDADPCVLVRVNKAGDSLYTLALVEAKDGRPTDTPLTGFDPRYARVQFSFKVDCPSDLDCRTDPVCPPAVRDEPEINYLAKDYGSFRQLILDRLALVMPGWRERHVPDIGIALVELLAYVGDHLSYYQDAVATEAYLDTARQRISVRRHARLVNYQLHEGCNARAWVTVWTDQDVIDPSLKLRDIHFTTGDGDGAREVFEPLPTTTDTPLELYVAHDTISFYTWGDEECCLPRGATAATLKDGWRVEEHPAPEQPPASAQSVPPQPAAGECPAPAPEPPQPPRSLRLKKGDVLIFEEVIGPKTGDPADADPTRRHVVRLVKVTPGEDPLFKQAIPGSEEEWPTPILEIEWAAEDALPFPLCISARLPAPECTFVEDISVAHGNVLLVDHGRTLEPEPLGQVGVRTVVGQCECEGSPVDFAYLPEPFRPDALEQVPLTYRQRLPHGSPPARDLLDQDPRKALPQITLTGLPGTCPEPGDTGEPTPREGIDPEDPEWSWIPQSDLLASRSQDQHFVVETDNDGAAHLRFGDGELGRMPDACMIFTARYRVGNGPAGNVPADTITEAAFRSTTVSGPTLRPRNPLPARGGTAPEPTSEAKLFAPRAFQKTLRRAITADDYARLAERNPRVEIQRAGASLRWTGSWYAAQVAIDPLGSETAARQQLDQSAGYLHRYRRAGHDLEVRPARYVPLKIELAVCVLPHYLRGHVEAALLEVLGTHDLADGRRGFFHPDNLTFGEGIYLSKLLAAAQAVTGVESVRVTTFQRLGEGDNGEIDNGILPLGPFEIAQLDNDPSFPEHGTLKLTMGGGR